MSRCEYCPAGWEDRSYEGECNGYGCLIYGNEIVNENCKLTKAEITKRLKQLEDYMDGKIDRPQWIINRFFREMDSKRAPFGHLGIWLPGFPPKRMLDGCYESIYSSSSLKDNFKWAYKQGYEDAKAGKEFDTLWK